MQRQQGHKAVLEFTFERERGLNGDLENGLAFQFPNRVRGYECFRPPPVETNPLHKEDSHLTPRHFQAN